MSDAVRNRMVVTIESTAWAVAFSAGMTSGIVLGYRITLLSLFCVSLIAATGALVCWRLLRAL